MLVMGKNIIEDDAVRMSKRIKTCEMLRRVRRLSTSVVGRMRYTIWNETNIQRGYFSVITCKRRSTNSYGRFVSRVGASLRLRLDPAITGSGDCQRTTGSSSTHMHLASQFRGIDTRTAVDLIHCCTYVIARKPAGSYRMWAKLYACCKLFTSSMKTSQRIIQLGDSRNHRSQVIHHQTAVCYQFG